MRSKRARRCQDHHRHLAGHHVGVAGRGGHGLVDRLGGLAGRRVVLVGAGSMGEQLGRRVASSGARPAELVIVNRTPAAAEALAAELGGRVAPLGDLTSELATADVCVTCTGAPVGPARPGRPRGRRGPARRAGRCCGRRRRAPQRPGRRRGDLEGSPCSTSTTCKAGSSGPTSTTGAARPTGPGTCSTSSSSSTSPSRPPARSPRSC